MARRFSTGAEEADLLGLWDRVQVSGSENQVGVPSLGAIEQITWQPRTGRGMYCLNSTQSLENYCPDNPGELYVGFAWRCPSALAAGWIFIFYTDTPLTYGNYLGIQLTATGAINMYRSGTIIATSPTVFAVNTWYYIEVWGKPRNTGGRFVVKVDGVIPTNMDFSGDTTADLEWISEYNFRGVVNTTLASFDDIVVNDTSGSYNNSWPGMVRLMPIRPASAGYYSQWNRGGVDLGDSAAQLRYGTFDFSMLETPSDDNKHTFVPEMPDLPANAAIQNILLNTKAKITSGSGFIAPMIRSNGVDSISDDNALVSNWRNYQDVWPINPATSGSWVESDLANLEIGISS
jgi:hypothetical protein